MKKLLMLLSIGTLGYAANAQSVFEKDPYLTQALDKENIKNVKVETSGGSILVSGASGEAARIEMYVTPNNNITGLSKDDLKKRLEEDYIVKINVADNKLTATAKRKKDNWDWKRSLNISFKIYLPGNLSSDLATSGGSIKLDNLNGEQVFATSGGSLKMDKLTGKIKGATSGGSITVTNCDADTHLTTSGGSITAESCKGDMGLATSGGSIHLSDLNGKIDAATSGGRIEGDNIKGSLGASTSGGSVHLGNIRGNVSASTSGGNMEVEVTELGDYVRISNSGGSIDLTLPANKGLDLQLHGNKIKTETLSNFSGSVTENYVEGKMNGGGTEVTVRTGSGRVSLNFK